MKRLAVVVLVGLLLVAVGATTAHASFSRLLERSNRYAVREWFPHRSAGYGERDIRPAADQAFALAVGIKAGDHSAATNRRRVRMVRVLLSELSDSYPHWGHAWQSGFWASELGVAALLLRRELPGHTRLGVRRVVRSEANRFIGYEVPYYRRHDVVLSPGDTKGEENAWNARVLSVALALFPRHPNRHAWALKNRELVVSALARPEDADGRYARLLRGGSNVNSDYTVTNHGHGEHPDYAAAILGSTGFQALLAKLQGRPVPSEPLLNHRQIYRRLTRSYERDGTIRRPWPDPLVEGRPPFAFALVDAQARRWGYGGKPAARWERLHLTRTLAPEGEWAAPYGEAWNQGILGAAAARGVLLDWLG